MLHETFFFVINLFNQNRRITIQQYNIINCRILSQPSLYEIIFFFYAAHLINTFYPLYFGLNFKISKENTR